MKYTLNGTHGFANSYSTSSLLASLVFLIAAICFFPALILCILSFFMPLPGPATPVFATDRILVSSAVRTVRRERSPPR